MSVRLTESYEEKGDYASALTMTSKVDLDDFETKMIEVRVKLSLGNIIGVESLLSQLKELHQNTLSRNNTMQLYSAEIRTYCSSGAMDLAEKALNNLLDIVKSQETDSITYGRSLLWIGFYYYKISDLKKAEIYFNKAKTLLIKHENNHLLGRLYLYYGALYTKMGKLKKSQKLLKQSLEYHEKTGNKHEQLLTWQSIGINHARQGELTIAKTIFVENLKESKKIYNEYLIASLSNNLGNIFQFKGELGKAEQYYSEAADIFHKLGAKPLFSKTSHNLAQILSKTGEIEKSMNIYKGIISEIESYSDHSFLSVVYEGLSYIHTRLGELSNAFYYGEKALTLRRELQDPHFLVTSLLNITKIHLLRGKIKLSDNSLKEAFSILEHLDNNQLKGKAHLLAAKLQIHKGNIKEAERNYRISLDMLRGIDNLDMKADSYFGLISLNIDQNEIDNAQNLTQELKELNKKVNSKSVGVLIKLAEAAILQTSSRVSQQAEAQRMFQEILDENLISYEMMIYAMLNTCKMLLNEYYHYDNNEGALNELEQLIAKIYEIAEQEKSYPILCEVLIIQSKISMVQGDYDLAEQYERNAYQIATNYELDRIKLRIDFDREQWKQTQEAIKKGDYDQVPEDYEIMQRIKGYIDDVMKSKEITDMVLHEMKNIVHLNVNLVNLISSDEEIKENASASENLEYLEMISRKMQNLASSYLADEIVKNGKYNLHPVLIAPWEIINERLSIYNKLIKDQHLKIIKNENENFSLITDGFLFSRVIDNLVNNAIKFSPRNGTIEIQMMKLGEFINISISNEGEPIPPRFQEIVFKKFSKNLGRSLHKKGFGLGLNQVKNAVNILNGSINLLSPITEEGEGVRFTLSLPVELEIFDGSTQ